MVNRWLTDGTASRRCGRATGRDGHRLGPITAQFASSEGNQACRKSARDQQVAVYFLRLQLRRDGPWTTNNSLTCTNSLPNIIEGLPRKPILDVVQHYHADLAQRLADEAALISRRTAIGQRLREGEQQRRNDLE